MVSRLQELRKAAGLSQEKLARKSDLSVALVRQYEQYVNKIEGAKYQTLLKISNILGVPFWELFDDPELEKAAICNTCCRGCALRNLRSS